MTDKLSFKEYLDNSKNKLREALNKTPQRTAEYAVRKYCKLVIGESKENKRYIPLKPKQKIFVEWLYDDFNNPTIKGIQFEGVKNIDPQQQHGTLWEGQKLQDWLSRNAREIVCNQPR